MNKEVTISMTLDKKMKLLRLTLTDITEETPRTVFADLDASTITDVIGNLAFGLSSFVTPVKADGKGEEVPDE